MELRVWSKPSEGCVAYLKEFLLCFALSAGQGAHEDIVVASARAYTHALNRMIGWMAKRSLTTVVPSIAQDSSVARGGRARGGSVVTI